MPVAMVRPSAGAADHTARTLDAPQQVQVMRAPVVPMNPPIRPNQPTSCQKV
ncbi:hypothetical protein GCM10010264_71680 [Streptomyces globisporus]|nr:hypothetical protein GCM10010264_71680 [Streptomyces globisporus]